MPNKSNVIGQCSCKGDIEENGENSRCTGCGLLYDTEIVKKKNQSQQMLEFNWSFGVPRELYEARQ